MLNSSSRSTLSLMIKPATYIDSLVYFHSLEWYNVSIHISSQWSFRVIDYCLIFYQFTTYLIDKQMPLLYFYLHWIEVSYFIKILYDFSLFSGKIKKYLNKIQVLYATRISLGSGGCHSEGCYSTEGFLAPRTTTLRIFFFFFHFVIPIFLERKNELSKADVGQEGIDSCGASFLKRPIESG